MHNVCVSIMLYTLCSKDIYDYMHCTTSVWMKLVKRGTLHSSTSSCMLNLYMNCWLQSYTEKLQSLQPIQKPWFPCPHERGRISHQTNLNAAVHSPRQGGRGNKLHDFFNRPLYDLFFDHQNNFSVSNVGMYGYASSAHKGCHRSGCVDMGVQTVHNQSLTATICLRRHNDETWILNNNNEMHSQLHHSGQRCMQAGHILPFFYTMSWWWIGRCTEERRYLLHVVIAFVQGHFSHCDRVDCWGLRHGPSCLHHLQMHMEANYSYEKQDIKHCIFLPTHCISLLQTYTCIFVSIQE